MGKGRLALYLRPILLRLPLGPSLGCPLPGLRPILLCLDVPEAYLSAGQGPLLCLGLIFNFQIQDIRRNGGFLCGSV